MAHRARKRGKHLKHGRSHRKKKGGSLTMVNRMPKQLHTVVAPRFMTTLEYGFTGNTANGAGVQGYFNVWANGIVTPGVEGTLAIANFNPFTATSGADLGVGGVVYPATVALTALQCVGETMLAGLYDKFRVHGSSIAVTVTPFSGLGMVTLVPLAGESLVAGIPFNDIQHAQSLPRAKAITVSPNNNIRQNRISAKCAPHMILGQTRQQYNDNPETSGLTSTLNPSDSTDLVNANQVFWQVNISPFSSTTSFSPVVEVRVTYQVEFFDPLGPTDT